MQETSKLSLFAEAYEVVGTFLAQAVCTSLVPGNLPYIFSLGGALWFVPWTKLWLCCAQHMYVRRGVFTCFWSGCANQQWTNGIFSSAMNSTHSFNHTIKIERGDKRGMVVFFRQINIIMLLKKNSMKTWKEDHKLPLRVSSTKKGGSKFMQKNWPGQG